MSVDRKRVTIVDVAHDAGVSHSTVSRVLSGSPRISEETKRKVQESIRRLGYVADLRGRALAGGRTGIVGLVVPDLRSQTILAIVRDPPQPQVQPRVLLGRLGPRLSELQAESEQWTP